MASDDQTEVRKGHTPPYIAFQSLKTMLNSFKAGGLPGRLDRSVLQNFSGAVGGQIITSLRFLQLIDDEGRPSSEFEVLINAYGTDQWPAALAEQLKKSYRPIFDINLETASPMQFNERFRATFPSKEETLRKCITFFLNASREAGIPISPYIMKNKKPRAAPTRRRASRPVEQRAQETPQNIPPRKNDPPKPNGSTPQRHVAYDVLIEILDPSMMEEDEMAAVWTLIRFLKRKEANK